MPELREQETFVVTAKKDVKIADGPGHVSTCVYEVYERPGWIDGPKYVLMSEELFLQMVAELDAARRETHPSRSREAGLWQTKATPI